jgi:cell division septal protein FtsQ
LLGFGSIAGAALLVMRIEIFIGSSDFFAIRNVNIYGASPALESEIRSTVERLLREGNRNLVAFRPAHALFYLEDLPRVRSIEIQKRYPRTIRIDVEEREPVTAVNVGRLFWIDREGVLLAEVKPEELADVSPPLTGVRGDGLAPGDRLDQPSLDPTLRAIEYLEKHERPLSRRFAQWHLTREDEIIGILDGGVEVRFGRTDPLAAMPMLATLMRVKPDWEQYTYFDLRFDSQIVYF